MHQPTNGTCVHTPLVYSLHMNKEDIMDKQTYLSAMDSIPREVETRTRGELTYALLKYATSLTEREVEEVCDMHELDW